jgi:hypothetical protein
MIYYPGKAFWLFAAPTSALILFSASAGLFAVLGNSPWAAWLVATAACGLNAPAAVFSNPIVAVIVGSILSLLMNLSPCVGALILWSHWLQKPSEAVIRWLTQMIVTVECEEAMIDVGPNGSSPASFLREPL